jgi:hypothetical protein
VGGANSISRHDQLRALLCRIAKDDAQAARSAQFRRHLPVAPIIALPRTSVDISGIAILESVRAE